MEQYNTETRSRAFRPALLIRRLCTALIVVYRICVSPLLGPACRFYPTCSAYAQQAIDKHGVCRGLVMAAWRLLKCHPFHPGGVDLVK
jgi:putative membrane protein insertion efficiency factor